MCLRCGNIWEAVHVPIYDMPGWPGGGGPTPPGACPPLYPGITARVSLGPYHFNLQGFNSIENTKDNLVPMTVYIQYDLTIEKHHRTNAMLWSADLHHSLWLSCMFTSCSTRKRSSSRLSESDSWRDGSDRTWSGRHTLCATGHTRSRPTLLHLRCALRESVQDTPFFP